MRYIKGLIIWIWEGKYLYSLVAIIFVVTFADNFQIAGLQTVDNIRVYGPFLQLTGTLTIVYSLRGKLLLFKGHGLWTFILNYFRSFPWTEKKKHYAMKADMGGYSMTTGDLRGVIRPKEDIKDVIRYLDEELQYVHKRLADTKTELKSNIETVKTDLSNLQSSLGKQIKETQKLISDSNVSNIWLDAFGISIIFVGLIYGTIPDIVEKIVW